MTGQHQAEEPAWRGYTLAQMHQMAARAAVNCRWGDRFSYHERFEVAWAGIVDYLADHEATPEPLEVYKAGLRAIGQATNQEIRHHGLTTGNDGLPEWRAHFYAYWAPRTAPPADAPVIDRLATAQIWPRLRPLHQLALLALAAHGDYAQAAEATGYPYSAFTSLIADGRAAFLELWHEGETPARPWAKDQHGARDPALRARRLLATRRRKQGSARDRAE